MWSKISLFAIVREGADLVPKIKCLREVVSDGGGQASCTLCGHGRYWT